MVKCNLGKVKLQANAVSGLLLKRTWSEGCPQGPFAYLVTYVASHGGIFELIFADLLLSESLRILAPSASLPFCALVSIRSGEYFPLNSFSVTVSVGSCMQGWFLLAGLPWIPPCYAWGVQAPVQPLRHQSFSYMCHLFIDLLPPFFNGKPIFYHCYNKRVKND